MKHLNSLCLVTTAFIFIFPLFANAQTPTVLTGLTPNTQHYYRVRAEKTSVAEQGAYSNVVSAQTTDYATSDNQIKTEDGGILIYPNPTAGKLYIDINTLQKIKAIKLYNLQGQPVMCIQNPSNPKIDISHFNTGMYC